LAECGVDILSDKICDVLITPHVKEFSRISGLSVSEILANPITCAQNFAREHNITVLLKNASTVITDGRKTALNIYGTTALAKGGSGDMLSGLICGNSARGLSLFESAVASAYILGQSAIIASEEVTDYCATAKELLKNLPISVKRLTT
jgi:NAD(P)H-hydrate epimerase